MKTEIVKQNINETEFSFPFKFSFQEGKNVVPSHWHKEMEIIKVEHGSISCEYNGESVTLHPGDIVVAASGDVHALSYADRHWRSVILFDLDIFEDGSNNRAQKSVIRRNIERIERFSTNWGGEVQKRVGDLIEMLHNEYDYPKEDSQFAIKAILYQIVLTLIRDVPKNEELPLKIDHAKQRKTLDTLQKVLTFVEENYARKITLEDIGKHLNFAPNYFARFFKKSMGTTFFTYLNNFRIKKAQELLLKDVMNITEISYHVGFNNVKTFNRLFKQATGITPTEYKKVNI